MRITTPTGTLEGENVEEILKAHGFDCLRDADLSDAKLSGADLRHADLSGADLRYADLRDADLRLARLPEPTVAQTSILPMKNMVVFAHGKYIPLPEGITGDEQLVAVILSGKAEGMVLFFRSTELRMVQLSGLLAKENSTRYVIQGSWGNKTTIVGAKIRYFRISQSYMGILGSETNIKKSLQDWLSSLGPGYYDTATPDEWQESFYTFIKKQAEEGRYSSNNQTSGNALSVEAFQHLVAADYKRG